MVGAFAYKVLPTSEVPGFRCAIAIVDFAFKQEHEMLNMPKDKVLCFVQYSEYTHELKLINV